MKLWVPWAAAASAGWYPPLKNIRQSQNCTTTAGPPVAGLSCCVPRSYPPVLITRANRCRRWNRHVVHGADTITGPVTGVSAADRGGSSAERPELTSGETVHFVWLSVTDRRDPTVDWGDTCCIRNLQGTRCCLYRYLDVL